MVPNPSRRRTAPQPVGAVLLAAGRGERLRPLTDDVPKPALPICDVPLAAWGLGNLRAAGLDVVVNVSHLASVVTEALSPFGDFDVLVEPSEPFGTAGTLRSLQGRLSNEVVTWNADVIADIDIVEVLELHRESGAPATVVGIPVDDGADLSVAKGRACAFHDRRRHPGGPGVVFAGIAVLGRSAVALIPEGDVPRGLGETILAPLANRGELAVYEHGGYFADVGTPESYREANMALLGGDLRLPASPPGRFSDGSYFGPEAKVEGRVLSSVVGAGAIVERGAHIERSVLLPGAIVERGSRLVEAIRGRGERPAAL